MMEKYDASTTGPATKVPNKRNWARKLKTEIYLKYFIIVHIMHNVKIHWKDDEYKFNNDERLSKILHSNFGNKFNNNKTKNIE